MNILIHIYVHAFLSLIYIAANYSLIGYVYFQLQFDNARLFFKMFVPIYIHIRSVTCCSTDLPTFAIIGLFIFSHCSEHISGISL